MTASSSSPSSSAATKITVFVVGPQKSGKTSIANHLADLADSLNSSEYHPTRGVRILEFDRAINPRNKEIVISVELWDCSGDPSFMANWPAVASSANAVLFVCSPEKKQEKELELWHSMFSFLSDSQMCVFGHKIGVSAVKASKPKFAKGLQRVPFVLTSLDEPDHLKNEFDMLLAAAHTVHAENRERDEQAILAARY
ncbi:P-loop containing nucleoside triphosphate hydrolase protein [Zopfochytrium polystomum]|nr:P-loop containing nucleoside triphosphate hydrolase protein [Zopfochytrium polystomum]